MKSVLCYGDSNTYGYNPDTGERFAPSVRWTGLLGTMLGEDYTVIEEGCNGRTAYYVEEEEPWKCGRPFLPVCLNSHKPLDLVILMLGTNDLKKMFSPDADAITGAIRGYIEEIRSFSEKKEIPVPQILLAAPPPLGADIVTDSPFAEKFDLRSLEISKKLGEQYRTVAEEAEVLFVDAGRYAGFSRTDSLHFNAEGHRRIAEVFCECVRKALQPCP